MKKILNIVFVAILMISISLNLFLRSNKEVNCENIDARWKANILYTLWHRHLDWDKDGIPCENLPYNQR